MRIGRRHDDRVGVHGTQDHPGQVDEECMVIDPDGTVQRLNLGLIDTSSARLRASPLIVAAE
jgi:hypothetical protein